MTPTNSSNDNIGIRGEQEQPAAAGARGRAGAAYASARERTRTAYDSARDRASDAFEATRQGVESNPVAALVGGLAIGAILAAVLPKSQREGELLSSLGQRVNEGARKAAGAAREAGVAKLDEFGVSTVKEKLAEIAGRGRESVEA